MTGAMFKKLEEKYGVRIVSDGTYWSRKRNKAIPIYKIYAPDGCPWENGLEYKDVLMECKKWAKELLTLKEEVTK